MLHKSVLLHEAIDGLNIKPGDIFVDGTLGGGGHMEEVCLRFGSTVVMIGIDLDSEAITRASARLTHFKCPIHYVKGSFRNIDKILNSLGMKQVDKILLDLGISSNQFEESGRGFSFQKDESLIMSFSSTDSPQAKFTARDIVNEWDEENIKTILQSYGEEQFAWKIAKAIVERRKIKPIETTFDLVEIVKSATPKFYHHRKIHPATKTFQALRITVNDETESLKEGIRKGFECLKPQGRLAVISFHSLEDRIVKQFFSAKGGKNKEQQDKEGIIITKKPVTPTEIEISENPRSRSAKLRIIEKS
ncbi:MAG: 16S rRNA (cytosine(1402)-N(4))-methyltransferase RsmH [Candidatus Zambryskibacteria bacterium]|nr:16S rRNA (cytosine(1402)-N(4))-methyltransferase RsmH [Candidatus Zambryskibacteria bacterium]